VRPDGTLKPHAEVIRKFAQTKPQVRTEPVYKVELDITPEEYYKAPLQHIARLYQNYLAAVK